MKNVTEECTFDYSEGDSMPRESDNIRDGCSHQVAEYLVRKEADCSSELASFVEEVVRLIAVWIPDNETKADYLFAFHALDGGHPIVMGQVAYQVGAAVVGELLLPDLYGDGLFYEIRQALESIMDALKPLASPPATEALRQVKESEEFEQIAERYAERIISTIYKN